MHASFSNLVLSEAFHTPERYTDRIVFPDGLSGFRNLTANILKERSGLIPTVVAVINNILVPIRKMHMTETEYILLQAIIFFDRGALSPPADGPMLQSASRSARRACTSCTRSASSCWPVSAATWIVSTPGPRARTGSRPCCCGYPTCM